MSVNSSNSTPETFSPQKPIKWSWLALSCASLLTGAVYLTTAELTGPATVSQVQTEQAE